MGKLYADGNCCEWCSKLAGTYDYLCDQTVYKRHNNCNCTVEYDPDSGKVQNVHTKQWTEPEENAKIEARKSPLRRAADSRLILVVMVFFSIIQQKEAIMAGHITKYQRARGEQSIMNLMELRKEKENRINRLEMLFAERYKQLNIHDMLCFRKKDGTIFHIVNFPESGAILIEYAESYDEAMIFRFEDGDRFYVQDMDEETMFQAMIDEIEQ